MDLDVMQPDLQGQFSPKNAEEQLVGKEALEDICFVIDEPRIHLQCIATCSDYLHDSVLSLGRSSSRSTKPSLFEALLTSL